MYTLEKVWPEWKVVKEIGRGSYGVVYKCVKEEKNHKKYAAVKVISVPRDEFEMEDVVSEKMTQEQSKAYYKDIADDLLKEIEILKSLKGTKNIVEIYDAQVMEKEDGIGWNIFISMEMLTDFTTYASDKKFTQEDVIKLGTDLCSALSVCHKARIIHRDIKPENIFVDDFGNFKLGDFGVAKQMAKTKGSVSVKGTYGYMSPEVFSGKKCDGRADLYSLALVMYKLLNNNRFPFIDAGKQIVKYSERQQAFERRIKGESIPAIKGVSNELNAVILKACSFKSVDRQKNIDEFRKQLESVGKGKKAGKKIRTALIAGLSALVVVSAVTGILYASNDSFKTKVDSAFGKEPIGNVETQKPEEREYNENFISLNNGKSVDGKYLVEGKGANAGKYYLVDGGNTVKNLSELCNIEQGHRILAYDGEKIYYSVNDPDGNDFDVYRYNCRKDISSKKPYIENVNIDSLVYFDDRNLYYVEIYDGPGADDKDEKKLVRYNLSEKKPVTIDHHIQVFEHNGYIIYSVENGTEYKCYDTTVNEESAATRKVTYKVAPDTECFIVGDKLYFVEETDSGNLAIKYFDFEKMENETESLEKEDKKSDSDTEDNGTDNLQIVDNTTPVATLDNIALVQNMPEAVWKIKGFNDKFAVVSNENAQDTEDKWYIWSYDSEKLNPIMNADKLFVEGNYEIFTDGDLIKIAVWESYICEIYEIDSSGRVFSIGSKFTKEKKEGSYRLGGEYFTIDNEGLKPAINLSNITFIEKEETVYPDEEAVAYMIPDDTVKDNIAHNYLNKNIGLTKLAESSNNWSKVIVDDEIVYIHTDKLKGYELNDIDKGNLTSEVEKTYSVKDAELIDYVNSGDEYTCFLTAKNNGAISYDVTLKVAATLNDNKTWEIKSADRKVPEDIEAMSKYIHGGHIKGFTDFSVYDINHDGVSELIAHKEKGKKRHGVYYFNESTGEYKMVNVNNEIPTKEMQLYEIKDQGVLCYYENSNKKPEENGIINLMIIGVDYDKGVSQYKLAYEGSADNIVPIDSFAVDEYKEVLG